jgi:hypothetical protein
MAYCIHLMEYNIWFQLILDSCSEISLHFVNPRLLQTRNGIPKIKSTLKRAANQD